MPDRLQRLIALLLLLPLLPLLAVLAIAIRMDSRGPILYRATRSGRGGRPFVCLKLRTMTWAPKHAGPPITLRDDPRVTQIGRTLRRFHLDEIPQLLNVARGEMRLVGPRPEDPQFVDLSDPLHRTVFSSIPGLTGLTQLVFADESRLLGRQELREQYRNVVLPAKLRIDARYLANRSVLLDARILAGTAAILAGWRPAASIVERWAPRPALVAE